MFINNKEFQIAQKSKTWERSLMSNISFCLCPVSSPLHMVGTHASASASLPMKRQERRKQERAAGEQTIEKPRTKNTQSPPTPTEPLRTQTPPTSTTSHPLTTTLSLPFSLAFSFPFSPFSSRFLFHPAAHGAKTEGLDNISLNRSKNVKKRTKCIKYYPLLSFSTAALLPVFRFITRTPDWTKTHTSKHKSNCHLVRNWAFYYRLSQMLEAFDQLGFRSLGVMVIFSDSWKEVNWKLKGRMHTIAEVSQRVMPSGCADVDPLRIVEPPELVCCSQQTENSRTPACGILIFLALTAEHRLRSNIPKFGSPLTEGEKPRGCPGMELHSMNHK